MLESTLMTPFSFGTGKLGDLAGFTSAIILAMIALLIGFASVTRILTPVPIHFAEAIPIACLGLTVNIASAWLLSGGGHIAIAMATAMRRGRHKITTDHGNRYRLPASLRLEVFEDGVPPRFRLRAQTGRALIAQSVTIETVRPDGARQSFIMREQGGFLESVTEIPEPHAFVANVRIGQEHLSGRL